MKVIIEKHLNGQLSNIHKWLEFNDIIQTIELARNEDDLRRDMKNTYINFFEYGFGSSHMWVHELYPDGKMNPERLLIVEF